MKPLKRSLSLSTRMPDINALKKELRRRYKAVRGTGDSSEQQMADRRILQRFMALPQYRTAPLVLTYVSSGGEVDTLQLIVRALADGKSVACPRCSKADRTMTFHRITALDQLAVGAYDIYEPAPDAPTVQPEELAESICAVPGLSFDAAGGRLGYGGGYYDRFLTQYSGTSVGLCRAECFSEAALPQDSYDVRVSCVLTDQ